MVKHNYDSKEVVMKVIKELLINLGVKIKAEIKVAVILLLFLFDLILIVFFDVDIEKIIYTHSATLIFILIAFMLHHCLKCLLFILKR